MCKPLWPSTLQYFIIIIIIIDRGNRLGGFIILTDSLRSGSHPAETQQYIINQILQVLSPNNAALSDNLSGTMRMLLNELDVHYVNHLSSEAAVI
jgi:hypothetical protein